MRTDLTFEQCEEILQANHYGHLGCSLDNQPAVFPVTYVYQYGYIYGYTQEGEKIRMMRQNPKVCMQVEEVETGYIWKSVICWGTFEECTDPKEKHETELLLAEHYAAVTLKEGKVPVSPPLKDLHLQKTDEIKKSVIYRINIQRTTGKAEHA